MKRVITALILIVLININSNPLNEENTSKTYQPGYHPYYPNKQSIPNLIPNTSYSIINIDQINIGYSKYGLLHNTNQYECSGGLNECIDSCCINGKCIESIYLCSQKSNVINLIYIITLTVFILLLSLFLVSYSMIEETIPIEVKPHVQPQTIIEKVKRESWSRGRILQHFPCINEIITERIDESSNIGQTMIYPPNKGQDTKREGMNDVMKSLEEAINEEELTSQQRSLIKKRSLNDRYSNKYREHIITHSDRCMTEEQRKTTDV